ncbi:MAG: hypothetical protein QOF27_2662, partial [Gaiellaceae bacterium]|nr:hypothetical protein [Gaiellaceae bacterium]
MRRVVSGLVPIAGLAGAVAVYVVTGWQVVFFSVLCLLAALSSTRPPL